MKVSASRMLKVVRDAIALGVGKPAVEHHDYVDLAIATSAVLPNFFGFENTISRKSERPLRFSVKPSYRKRP